MERRRSQPRTRPGKVGCTSGEDREPPELRRGHRMAATGWRKPQIPRWCQDSRHQEDIMVNPRWLVRFFAILAPILLILDFGYVFHTKKQPPGLKIGLLQTHFQLPKKEFQQPANNQTYPAFHHPLAPPYPYPYKFLINQPDKCKDRTPFLIMLVMGKVHDLEARHTIRATWGNESNYDVDVMTIFLLGFSSFVPDRTQMLLEEESEAFGDIVQQDFMDTYYNLTLKILLGMEWVTKFCPNASYVMKIDNDMFLNVDYLVHKYLRPELPVREKYFTGYVLNNTKPIRNSGNKWYVPEEIYPNDTYPPYCAGPGYVFSADMAKKIYDVSQRIRVIPMEDSFMGICLYELHITITPFPQDVFSDLYTNDRCQLHKLIMAHHYSSDQLRTIWPDFWTLKTSGCE
ncbi:beta-1,3-galactosyltransferase 1-like [Hyperolius riggenbachi]|uniref:beta-1,3-galactosyltransferase 1-like n=1 Tax=Hyperolius riggenbachi TaxID=752182 RepID=UPI0035A266B0